MNYYRILRKICNTRENVNLKDYCSIKIGGVGRYVCFPRTVRQVKKLAKFLIKTKTKYYILGNGTNIIFEDGGYSGVLICLKNMNRIIIKNGKVSAYAGANLFYLNQICANGGYSGLEFSYGIPGTIGGAVCMNAGAYGKEMKDIVKYVWVLKNGTVQKLSKKDLNFGYRTSILQNSKMIVLKVQLKLKQIKGIHKTTQNDQILQKMQQIMQKRLQTQPYGTLNSGSIFKKTQNESAGKYIDKLGLKGVKIEYIQISQIHANFFINLGNATSENLHKVINLTKEKVKKEFGIILEQEVIFVGD